VNVTILSNSSCNLSWSVSWLAIDFLFPPEVPPVFTLLVARSSGFTSPP